ncbi:hypothetical protein [Thiolapillus sp.]|uniref:hypothetical protein n=1 Tax=Thiolapillus sp. TaxID=2017437 RepID=UPI003AF8687F
MPDQFPSFIDGSYTKGLQDLRGKVIMAFSPWEFDFMDRIRQNQVLMRRKFTTEPEDIQDNPDRNFPWT